METKETNPKGHAKHRYARRNGERGNNSIFKMGETTQIEQ